MYAPIAIFSNAALVHKNNIVWTKLLNIYIVAFKGDTFIPTLF